MDNPTILDMACFIIHTYMWEKIDIEGNVYIMIWTNPVSWISTVLVFNSAHFCPFPGS